MYTEKPRRLSSHMIQTLQAWSTRAVVSSRQISRAGAALNTEVGGLLRPGALPAAGFDSRWAIASLKATSAWIARTTSASSATG